jgi:hypothetical protein
MIRPAFANRWKGGMDWLYIVCGIVGAWACLRVIGAERERRMLALKAEIASRPSMTSPPPPPAPEPAPVNVGRTAWAAKTTPANAPVHAKAVR